MPIATGTALAYAATLLTGLGAYLFSQRDDDDESPEDTPDGPLPLPPSKPAAPLIPGFKPTVIGKLDLDYMEEDEGDLVLDPIEVELLDIDPDTDTGGGQAGYPWQTNHVPGQTGSYNSSFFDDNNAVRRSLYFLGYNVPYASWGVQLQEAPPASEAKRFQHHYNQASEREHKDAKGYLKEDGILGPASLRALERAVIGTDGEGPTDIIRGPLWREEFGV